MKKLMPLLVSVMAVAYIVGLIGEPVDAEAAVQPKATVSSLSFETESISPIASSPKPEEQPPYNRDIPLSYEEQILLMKSCEENDIPYALALGLIEKETNFRNITGDDGASMGYMQIQEKWHWDRMERLGVTDLLDPKGNFQVGCDFLSELYARYKDWGTAVTVYNMGHDPGYITAYANDVLSNYVDWKKLIGACD